MRNWGDAKRDWLKFRGKKIKARQFVAMVAAALPKMVDNATDQLIDHAEKLKEAYCRAGLVGMEKYERAILDIQQLHEMSDKIDVQALFFTMSIRARRAISSYFGKDFDLEPIESIAVLSGLNRDRLASMKNVGAGTLKEIDDLMAKLKLEYVNIQNN